VYVSEARDAALLRQLESLARGSPGACLANLFVDEPYNRTNLTLVGRSMPQLAAAAVGLARAALAALDLRQHAATHPRLGTVDHISCHPLPLTAGASAATAGAAGQATPAEEQQAAAAALAQAIARQLGAGPLALPVFTYGKAHPQQRPLDAVRRQLGYFQGAAAGAWQGGLQLPAGQADVGAAAGAADPASQMLALPLAPCYGPGAAPARSGVCCVGAAPWVVNFNVLLLTDDMAAARAIARGASERGGGLVGVQAMALRHVSGIEVACNLLGGGVTEPAVLAAVRALAEAAGLALGGGYRTNKAPEELVAAAMAAGL
jgi:glutamate formiminotransferase